MINVAIKTKDHGSFLIKVETVNEELAISTAKTVLFTDNHISDIESTKIIHWMSNR